MMCYRNRGRWQYKSVRGREWAIGFGVVSGSSGVKKHQLMAMMMRESGRERDEVMMR